MLLRRLRLAGFRVRLTPEGKVGITPSEWITDERSLWIRANRVSLIYELKHEEAANDSAAELRQCSQCVNDEQSPYNPMGGLTWCAVRSDDDLRNTPGELQQVRP